MLEAVVVERVAHLAHEPLVHPRRLEVAQLLPERAVDEHLRRVEPHAPELRAERARNVERRLHGVVLEVDEHRDVHVVGGPLRELRRGEHGVAAVGRDQRVRHRADAAAAPPRRLLVGGDADRRADHPARDVGGIPVARLHAVMIVARRHEDDRLAVRRLEHAHDVRVISVRRASTPRYAVSRCAKSV